VVEVITLKEVRLNGEDVPAGMKVTIPGDLVKDWLGLGLAQPAGDGAAAGNSSPPNQPPAAGAPYESLPGGWYKFADGKKIRGKVALEVELKARKSGE
jgi:hypothetical protein